MIIVDLCRMLAYRVEDINVRLEPQDLYAREDHENNIQVDVRAMTHSVCRYKSVSMDTGS